MRWVLRRCIMVNREKMKCGFCFFFSSRRRHTRFDCDWSSDVCSSDLGQPPDAAELDASVGEPGQQLAGELGVSLLAETFLPGRAVRRPGRTPPVDELGRDRRGTDDAGQRISLAEQEGGRRVGSLAL